MMAVSRTQGSACNRHRIIHYIVVVCFVALTAYQLAQIVSLFWSLTSNMETEVDVLRKEVQFLRAELSDRMNSLREQYERDLSDRLQIGDMDHCTDTICDELSKLDDNSEKIVKDALSFYGNSAEGQINFASGSMGASIITTYGTSDHDSTHSGTQGHSVQNIIKGCVVPGECWAFEGAAAVVIKLIHKVNIKAVSIEHASSGLLSTEERNSAPKDFSVWGTDIVNGLDYLLGQFSYDINGSPLQTFTIQKPPETPVHLIQLQIHSNHGNPTHTCLYRFRVHGSMTDLAEAQTSSETESE